MSLGKEILSTLKEVRDSLTKENRCPHDVHGNDCYQCYPSKLEEEEEVVITCFNCHQSGNGKCGELHGVSGRYVTDKEEVDEPEWLYTLRIGNQFKRFCLWEFEIENEKDKHISNY